MLEKIIYNGAVKPVFQPLPDTTEGENQYVTRNEDNKKIEVADLFTHFTASIIQQDTAFTR